MDTSDIIKRKEMVSWITTVIIAVLLSLFVRFFIFNIVVVRGESMYPTLNNSDKLVLNKIKASLGVEDFKKGDMVCFRLPGEEVDFIKRIVALEGDEVSIKNGKLRINGEIIEEKYIKEGVYIEGLEYGDDYTVPKGYVFVLGDNREPYMSYDSRSFGAFPIELLKGKIVMQVYPLNKFGETGK